MKILLYGIAVLAYLYLCTYVFNHGYPWIGIGLGVGLIAFAVYKAEKIIKAKFPPTSQE